MITTNIVCVTGILSCHAPYYFHKPHFPDIEIEAQRGSEMFPVTQQQQDLHSGLSDCTSSTLNHHTTVSRKRKWKALWILQTEVRGLGVQRVQRRA